MIKEKDFPQISENRIKGKQLIIREENKKEIKEEKDILKKFLSPTLIELNKKERNSYFEIMINDLANFKFQRAEFYSSKDNAKNKEIFSNNLVYNYLEKYLLEISYLNDKGRRDEEISKVYNWYKEKKKLEKDIKTITYKTFKEKNTIDEKEYFLIKKYKYKFSEKEKDHRNLEIIKKKMLDDYERKKLKKPFWALKKSISSQTLGSNISSSTNFTRNKYEKIDLNSIYSISKGTNNPTKRKYNDETMSYIDKVEGGLLEKDYMKQNPDENIPLPPVDKETKYSYSYLRPMYDLNTIFLENKIIEEKNKQLAEKREKEEMNKKLKEFSLFRAKLKENLNNRFEMKNLINLYIERNNISSSFVLNKYKIKEAEKQTNEYKNINEYSDLNSTEINNRKSCNLSLNNFKSEKAMNNTIKEDNSNNSNSNIKSESSEKNVETRLSRRRSNTYYKKINPFPKVNLFELSDSKNKDKNEYIKNFRLSLSKKFSLKKGRKTIIKRNASLTLAKFIPLKLFSGTSEKIKTTEIQNLEKESKTVKITDNTKIKNYQIKFPQEKSNNELLDKNSDEKKYDTIPHIISNDPRKREKFIYEKLCKFNAIKTNKDLIDTDLNQRTKWDLFNKDNIEKANKILLAKIKRRNEFIKLNKKYNTYKNNLLNLRRSLSNDKRIEYQNLIDKIRLNKLNEYDDEIDYEFTELESNKTNIIYNYKSQNKSDNKNNSLLNALVNPKDNFNYSKFYLPRNGSMLLSREKIKKLFN